MRNMALADPAPPPQRDTPPTGRQCSWCRTSESGKRWPAITMWSSAAAARYKGRERVTIVAWKAFRTAGASPRFAEIPRGHYPRCVAPPGVIAARLGRGAAESRKRTMSVSRSGRRWRATVISWPRQFSGYLAVIFRLEK